MCKLSDMQNLSITDVDNEEDHSGEKASNSEVVPVNEEYIDQGT